MEHNTSAEGQRATETVRHFLESDLTLWRALAMSGAAAVVVDSGIIKERLDKANAAVDALGEVWAAIQKYEETRSLDNQVHQIINKSLDDAGVPSDVVTRGGQDEVPTSKRIRILAEQRDIARGQAAILRDENSRRCANCANWRPQEKGTKRCFRFGFDAPVGFGCRGWERPVTPEPEEGAQP